jgi:hypothetical protein
LAEELQTLEMDQELQVVLVVVVVMVETELVFLLVALEHLDKVMLEVMGIT